MKNAIFLVLCVVLGICGYGFGVIDTLNDIRTKCPDLYEAIEARVKEDDHATD